MKKLLMNVKRISSWNIDSVCRRFQHSNTYCLRIADFIEDEIEVAVEYRSCDFLYIESLRNSFSR